MLKLGCFKDKSDKRDYLMRAYLPLAKVPVKIDYTQKASPVRDQGESGTCVGFACATGMKEYQELIDYSKLIILSPRFVYEECKKVDGMPGAEGTTLRAAMQVLKKRGVCREKYWPYAWHQKIKRKRGAVKNAKKFRVKTYARILDLNELRMSVASKGPCVMGVKVYQGMMDTKTGLIPMPGKKEYSLGGHAICIVGYDDKKSLVKFKNSWSDKWGNKGYGFLHYEYIERFMMDAWSSVDIDDPKPLTLASIRQA